VGLAIGVGRSDCYYSGQSLWPLCALTIGLYPGGLTNYNANDQLNADTYDAERTL